MSHETIRQATGWAGSDDSCAEIASVHYQLNCRDDRVFSGIAAEGCLNLFPANEKLSVVPRFNIQSVQPLHYRLDGSSIQAMFSRPTSSNLGWTSNKNDYPKRPARSEIKQATPSCQKEVRRLYLASVAGLWVSRLTRPTLCISPRYVRAYTRPPTHAMLSGFRLGGWTDEKLRRGSC